MKPREQQKFLAIASTSPVWERRPRESGPAFDAFLIFREMGVKRQISEVARVVGKSGHLLRRWATQWDWYIRVAAWDEMIADRRNSAAIEEAKRMGERQARLGMQMQTVGERRLAEFASSPELSATLTARDTVQLIKEGAELERVARGDDNKNEKGGNIIFNINMKSPPSWAPANVVKTIAGEIAKTVTTDAD